MNTKVLGLIAVVVVLGVGVIVAINLFDSEAEQLPVADTPAVITRPAVEPVPNTFSVMTEQERAEAAEAERLAAEAALLASTTPSSTASSTEEDLEN